MIMRERRSRFLFLLLLWVSVVACPSPQDARTESERLRAIADEVVQFFLKTHPEASTALGVHDYDAQVRDMSQEALRQDERRIQRFLESLGTIHVSDLSRDEWVDWMLLESRLQLELFELTVTRGWQTNPMTYPRLVAFGLNSLITKNFAPLGDRLKAVMARERNVPGLLRAARENLRNPSPVLVQMAIEMTTGLLRFVETDLPSAFDQHEDPSLEEEFRRVHSETTEEVKAFLSYLTDELLPIAQGDHVLGEERYLQKLRFEEMIEMSIDELLDLGTAELSRLQHEFRSTAEKIDSTASPRTVMLQLSQNHPSPEHLIGETERLLDDLIEFINAHNLVGIPTAPKVKVAPTPPFRRWSNASMLSPGPFEMGAKEAYYYITPPEDDWPAAKSEEHMRFYNRYFLQNVSIHEAYPGHYHQFLFLRDAPTSVRKLFPSAAFTEGWAHYCEQMMVDEGYGGGDPAVRLFQLQSALRRIGRFLVGIQLHTRGMTLEEGVRFFVANCFMEEHISRKEATRATFDPTYLRYSLGKLKILQLRERYRQARGEAFSLREFHESLLREGALPLPLLEKVLMNDPIGV